MADDLAAAILASAQRMQVDPRDLWQNLERLFIS